MKSPATRSPPTNAALAEGDARRLFNELCEPCRPDLYRFLFWLCHDRALAEDVMQETLLRAWRCFDSLADRKAAKPWLLTIARRELARVFERKRPETIDIDALTSEEEATLSVRQSEDLEEMRRALVQLEPGYREPLVLQVLFGYSTEEIARHMELTLPAVLTRPFRARQRLRKHMLEAADDGGPLP
ncbi:MAG: sigma-70 family RNA polymerase sigma factor [Dehalococcoidia bacterium]